MSTIPRQPAPSFQFLVANELKGFSQTAFGTKKWVLYFDACSFSSTTHERVGTDPISICSLQAHVEKSFASSHRRASEIAAAPHTEKLARNEGAVRPGIKYAARSTTLPCRPTGSLAPIMFNSRLDRSTMRARGDGVISRTLPTNRIDQKNIAAISQLPLRRALTVRCPSSAPWRCGSG